MNFAIKHAVNKVALTPDNADVLGGRDGTVLATREELIRLFGEPQRVDSPDDKVTIRWVFSTPRGFIEVRDYWWNGPAEWSIGSAEHKATQWLVRFLRSKGLEAGYGRRFAPGAPLR